MVLNENNDDSEVEIIIEEELIFIDSVNKYINNSDEILIKNHVNIMTESINVFNDSLSSTIDKLYEVIDSGKNLFIRTMLLRNANDGSGIDVNLLERSKEQIETISNIINLSTSESTANNDESSNTIHSSDYTDDVSIIESLIINEKRKLDMYIRE